MLVQITPISEVFSLISAVGHLARHPLQNVNRTGKENTPYISTQWENAIFFFDFSSVTDLCGKNKEITMVRMYEIELECDALFV